ncbi:YbaB/EbfC family nucleoid-associated protein [Patescibacteria group bacterium]|nr:YbaB/EbfC family nucleoid-associated protein [Patescibacteria group bacterium]
MFGQAKDLYKLQKKAKQVKKDLKNLHIEAEVEGVLITINGEQEVVDLKIPEELLNSENKHKLQQTILAAFNKAIKKSQEVAAERMKDVMDEMGLDLPGMTGGAPS